MWGKGAAALLDRSLRVPESYHGAGQSGGSWLRDDLHRGIKQHVNGARHAGTERRQAAWEGKAPMAQDRCSLPSDLIEVIQISAN